MDKDNLKELADQKEKEWREIQEKRIISLETLLKQKTQDLTEEKTKLNQLKEDFKYNLKLLEERDSELEKFEQSLTATRKQLAEKNSEISELKIKIDELKKLTNNEKNILDECKKYYVNRLNQKQHEIDKYKAAKDSEINQERSEIEKYKRMLQRELQDLQFDLEKQRNELKTEFDEVMRKREHEWRLQADEFSTQLMAKELQIKLLSNELDMCKEVNDNLKKSMNELESNLKASEKKLKEKEWNLKDTVALSDAKINETESTLNQLRTQMKTMSEDLNRKHEEMDRLIREKDLSLEKLKQSFNDEQKKCLYLEQQINEYKIQIKHMNISGKEGDKEKENQIVRLNEEIFKLKLDLNNQIEQKAKETVSKDISVEELKQSNEKLVHNLQKRNEESKTLKAKITEMMTRMNELEHEKLQLNLDWQNKYQYLENFKAQDSEQFTKQILESRNKALSKIKQLEDKLSHKENVIKALQTADPALNSLNFDSNEFQLKEENEKLKQIVKQMREEMENIANEPESALPLPVINKSNQQQQDIQISSLSQNNFEEDLKKQLSESKQKNRQLQSQLDDLILNKKLPDNLPDNTIINSHMKSLNETISILRKEKVDLTALCKKQQTKLVHFEKNANDLNEQVRVKQTQIETLQYEMNSQTRRTSTEINNLKQTLANLELELSATRREADEYHKMTIEKSSEVASLETKISELKLKLSSSGTQLNFGAQELFIQQLQDEIKRLTDLNQQYQIKARQLAHQNLRNQQQFSNQKNEEDNNRPSLNAITSSKEIENLKSKLKSAAKYITHLIQEKEHLIEMSNQLRGELNRIKYDNENISLVRLNREITDNEVYTGNQINSNNPHSISQSPKSALANKLKQLEKKQYELTKQQLAFAQKRSIAKSDPGLNMNYKNSNYKEKDSDSMSVISNDDAATVSSSIKSENFKEIWKIIDEHENDPIASAIKVKGLKPQVVAKNDAIKSPSKKSGSISARNIPESNNNKFKIRNYNDKS